MKDVVRMLEEAVSEVRKRGGRGREDVIVAKVAAPGRVGVLSGGGDDLVAGDRSVAGAVDALGAEDAVGANVENGVDLRQDAGENSCSEL